jgi:hypothetical protein
VKCAYMSGRRRYDRVAQRFFKVPEFLAEDYLAGGETATCDWMIMTDDDAWVVAIVPLVAKVVAVGAAAYFVTSPTCTCVLPSAIGALHPRTYVRCRYINIPQWENLFRNTAWVRPEDQWHLGSGQRIGFHKGSVPFLHGTSISFSRGAISAYGTWVVRAEAMERELLSLRQSLWACRGAFVLQRVLCRLNGLTISPSFACSLVLTCVQTSSKRINAHTRSGGLLQVFRQSHGAYRALGRHGPGKVHDDAWCV